MRRVQGTCKGPVARKTIVLQCDGFGPKASAHTDSKFRKLIFGAIPEDWSNPKYVRAAFPPLMGDCGREGFGGLIVGAS